MINITGTVTGDKAVIARLNTTEPRVRQALTEAALRIGIHLESYVRKNKLSGQLLKRRTGTLAASIDHKVTSTSSSVTAVIGSRVNATKPLAYARALEDGFDGVVTVKEHLRMVKQAFGKPLANPHNVTVRGHTAKRKTKAYRYLASSLAENRDSYIEQLRAAAVKGAQL